MVETYYYSISNSSGSNKIAPLVHALAVEILEALVVEVTSI